MEKQEVADCFSIIGVSPIKVHGKPFSNRKSIGKRKIATVTNVIKEKVAKSLDIPVTDIETSDDNITADLKRKAAQFDKLLVLIKNKLDSCKSFKERIQVLTLCPSDWSIEAASQYFGVSSYLIRKSKALSKEKGILSLPEPKKGKILNNETITVVTSFYEDNENSRQMPGQKDFVSVSRNVHMQELYEFIVCDPKNKECMVHRCDNCPDNTDRLEEKLYELVGEYEEGETIEFNQWVTTDRSDLILQNESVPDYINIVIEKLVKLTVHSYISKCQSSYLKKLKEELLPNSAIILGDFAENYSFVVQDEVQGFHWNNLQCTLHPVVVYYKEEQTLKHTSYCIISDDNNHDVAMVYKVQEVVINNVKQNNLGIQDVVYFSDGCAAQYKNRKNIYNLCHHKSDFEIDAKWVFFATSHGKQPCDGIGGTVKRLVAKASLQRTSTNQILNPFDMFTYCTENITGITFFYITTEELAETRMSLSERFEKTTTIPGTRSFHEFLPVDENTVKMKYCSEDEVACSTHKFCNISAPLIVEIKLYDYVCCVYDNHWWIGLIQEKNDDEEDVQVKFMHPHGPSPSFKWPTFDDICWLPYNHILHQIDSPCTSTGRSYVIKKNENDEIVRRFQEKFA